MEPESALPKLISKCIVGIICFVVFLMASVHRATVYLDSSIVVEETKEKWEKFPNVVLCPKYSINLYFTLYYISVIASVTKKMCIGESYEISKERIFEVFGQF